MGCICDGNRRILLEDRIQLTANVVSLDVLRLGVSSDQASQLVKALGISPRADTQDEHFAAVLECVCSSGALAMYVADADRSYGCRIRPEAFSNSCRGWSAFDSIIEGRFVTKPHMLFYGSLELSHSGQPLYLQLKAFADIFRQRPTPDATLRTMITKRIGVALAKKEILIKREVVRQLYEQADVNGVSRRHISDILSQEWPSAWRKGGRRRGT